MTYRNLYQVQRRNGGLFYIVIAQTWCPGKKSAMFEYYPSFLTVILSHAREHIEYWILDISRMSSCCGDGTTTPSFPRIISHQKNKEFTVTAWRMLVNLRSCSLRYCLVFGRFVVVCSLVCLSCRRDRFGQERQRKKKDYFPTLACWLANFLFFEKSTKWNGNGMPGGMVFWMWCRRAWTRYIMLLHDRFQFHIFTIARKE